MPRAGESERLSARMMAAYRSRYQQQHVCAAFLMYVLLAACQAGSIASGAATDGVFGSDSAAGNLHGMQWCFWQLPQHVMMLSAALSRIACMEVWCAGAHNFCSMWCGWSLLCDGKQQSLALRPTALLVCCYLVTQQQLGAAEMLVPLESNFSTIQRYLLCL
jgi:hypothetical protein